MARRVHELEPLSDPEQHGPTVPGGKRKDCRLRGVKKPGDVGEGTLMVTPGPGTGASTVPSRSAR